MITTRYINQAQPVEFAGIKNTLVIDKMKLDKFFSVFLDKYEITEDNLDTPEWFTYREMLKHYDHINNLIKTIDYRIQNA